MKKKMKKVACAGSSGHNVPLGIESVNKCFTFKVLVSKEYGGKKNPPYRVHVTTSATLSFSESHT